MRHLVKVCKLSRNYKHKKLMFFNLCNSLIKYEFIKTTLFKAKELRKVLEPLINISKFFSNFNINKVYNKLRNLESVLKLFKILAPRYIDRNCGYLKLYKMGVRKGDNCKLSLIKFI